MPDYSILLEFAGISYILCENEASFYSICMRDVCLTYLNDKKQDPNAEASALGLVMYDYFASFGSHVDFRTTFINME